jgi:hypothetical protein
VQRWIKGSDVKKIAYSLFTPTDLPNSSGFVFAKYLLGVYFNARMNRLLYPEWQTVVYVDHRILERHCSYFKHMSQRLGLGLVCIGRNADRPLWELVLSRIAPLFDKSTTHVICRDLDSITTYREALAVQEWLDSGMACHAMADNVAHRDPLMAGMCGFDVAQVQQLVPEYDSFEKLIHGNELSWRGSDQLVLRLRLWPKCKKSALAHCFNDCVRSDAAVVKTKVTRTSLQGVRSELWESNLVTGFIGQAGVNEMELLRFFQRHDDDPRFYEFEDEHSDICYWRRCPGVFQTTA